MKFMFLIRIITILLNVLTVNTIILNQTDLKNFLRSGALDLNVLRCFLRNTNMCPNPYITHRLYTPKSSRHGIALNIHNPLTLYQGGFSKYRETVFIVHGFNGTAIDRHLQFLRDAYLSRDFNVITVDWRPLTQYPCYLSALINTRLTAQCTAQVYSFLTHHGAAREKITCVGHSLGAHICGMISNHLSIKQYKIIGLDPARPLIERKKPNRFRLTMDDANVIQVLHTNAGFLGLEDNTGHLNYCINGGRTQPYCRGNPIRRARCSHFLSICYLASATFKHKKYLGVPCPDGCVDITGPKRLPITKKNPFELVAQIKEYYMGNDAPDSARGCYCLDVPYVKHCPFTDITKSSRHGIALNIHNPLTLYQGGFSKYRETVFIVHGFNGTAIDRHLQFLRDAYLSRDFNVITVDWRPLTQYPCYLSALINTRLTAQCTAQVYSFLTHHGAAREKITCVGHSLGAHICGMISNHLSIKQYKIIGLDPARPLIERKKPNRFRLTMDDANVIQVLHTNAGFLGLEDNTGHLNYCINGGRTQPYCRGNPIRRARCSHFLSICYLASATFKHKKYLGVPCPDGCVDITGPKRLPITKKNPFELVAQIKEYYMGNDAPDSARGCYCLDVPYVKHCPFTDIT